MLNFRLKELREEKGITQQALADVLCCSQQTINSYENRGSQPDVEMLSKIADYFDTSVDYLIGRSDVRYSFLTSEDDRFTRLEKDVVENIDRLPKEMKESVLMIIDLYLKK